MLLVTLVPLAIAMGLALLHSTKQTTSITLEVAQGRLDTAAQKLSRYFSERTAELSAYSQTEQIKTMDFKKMRPFLISELARHKNIYEKFIVGTPEGYFYNTSGGNPNVRGLRTFNDKEANAKPKHIRKRDYWQQTVGKNLSAKQITYISDPMISYTTGAKQIVVASTILSPNNSISGMIGGALPWQDIEARIKEVNQEVVKQLKWQAQFFLVSHNGTYWYHSNPENIVQLKLDPNGEPILNDIGEKIIIKTNILDNDIPEIASSGRLMLKQKSGYTTYIDKETKTENYLIYSHIPSANYSIGIIVPRNEILSPVRNLQSIFAYTFFIATIFAVLAALIVSRKVSSPIMSLNTMAKEISQGNWNKQLTPKGKDEIRELTESFNTMSESIHKREQALLESEERLERVNAELEQRIINRTQELEVSNKNLTQEVSERISIESSLRNSEALLKNTGHLAHIGGWKYTVSENRLFWTEETYTIHGVSDSTAIDLDTAITFISIDDQKTFHIAINQAIENKEPFDLELRLTKSNKENIWVRVICHVNSENDKAIELIGAYQDITDLKKIEKLKNEFVSMVSHELRTPLTAISGALILLTSGQIKIDCDAAARKMLNIASRNSERLLILINDLLDMNKIELGEMDFSLENYSLNKLIMQSLNENESYAKSFSTSYEVVGKKLDVDIKVDKERFLQAMSNLLSNAAKFTAKNSIIAITESVTNNNEACISVRDFGHGIPDSFQDKVFDKFAQADSTDERKPGGTGLGLPITKSIIEHMGGHISYTSTNKGCTFSITLPIYK